MLVTALGRANELLTGAFFAHQPWSAQRASGIVEAAWLNSGWSQTIFFLPGNTAGQSRNHDEAPGPVQGVFCVVFLDSLVVSVSHGEKNIVGG